MTPECRLIQVIPRRFRRQEEVPGGSRRDENDTRSCQISCLGYTKRFYCNKSHLTGFKCDPLNVSPSPPWSWPTTTQRYLGDWLFLCFMFCTDGYSPQVTNSRADSRETPHLFVLYFLQLLFPRSENNWSEVWTNQFSLHDPPIYTSPDYHHSIVHCYSVFSPIFSTL